MYYYIYYINVNKKRIKKARKNGHSICNDQ